MVNRKMSIVRRRGVGVLIATSLLTAPLAGIAPAVAAPMPPSPAAEPQVYEWPLDRGPSSRFTSVGAASPESRRIEVGPATTVLVVEPDLPEVDDVEVTCQGSTSGRPVRQFSAEEWAGTSVHTVDIAAGAFRTGRTYTYRCFFSRGEENSYFTEWTVISVDGAPATVTLDTDPLRVVSVADNVDTYPYIGENYPDVQPRDHIRVVGGPGDWGDRGLEPVVEAQVSGGYPALINVDVENVTLSADASTVDLDLPTTFPDALLGQVNRVQIRTVTTVPGSDTTPVRTRAISWHRDVTYPALPTTTTLRLNRPIGTSTYPTKAIVTVRNPVYIEDYNDTVSVYLDGRLVGQHLIDGRRSHTVQVDLGRVHRGTHTVRAEFTSRGGRAPSTSGDVRLRILF